MDQMDTIIPINTPTKKGPILQFIESSWRAIIDPVGFFRDDFPHFSLPDSLSFGLINAWLASLLSFFWSTMNSFLLVRLFERWVQRMVESDQAISFIAKDGESFLWAAGALVLMPFMLLARSVFSALVLFVFARILISDEQHGREALTFRSVLKIQGVSLVGNWFSIVPFFGGILSFFVCLVLSVTGVRERFGTSTRRAVAIVFAPYIVIFLGLLLFGIMMVLLAAQLPFERILDFQG